MTSRLPRSQPTGLLRLRSHVRQRRRWVALLLACAVGEAFAQSGSWLLVREAINEGIVPRDEHALALATAAYVAASLLGCPALTLPLLQDEGLPLGLQLLGMTDRDAALFDVANWVASVAFGRTDLVGAAG